MRGIEVASRATNSYHDVMADSVHISEEVAVRDFPGWVDRVLAGEKIFVVRDGRDLVALEPVTATARHLPEMKTLGEVLDGLVAWKQIDEKTNPDRSFAADLRLIHDELNQPLDEELWG